MKTVELSDEQEAARAAIIEFIESRRGVVFTLFGLAGTGKTTVLASIARQYRNAYLCTLTGKAASVLRRKTGLPAATIHSVFYRIKETREHKSGRKHLIFEATHAEEELSDDVLLLDECSMISDRIAADLLATGIKIVACGDPGQLPPVEGNQYFQQVSGDLDQGRRQGITLLQIHRQAQESPIIRQAHNVRNGLPVGDDGPNFRIVKQAEDDDMKAAGVILTWTNATRKAANEYARRVRGFWQPFPQIGEPVMCLKNAPDYGVFNGGVYELQQPFIQGDTDITINVDGETVCIPSVRFQGIISGLKAHEEARTTFDFGYACTVHKSQGSEWPFVILIDEYRKIDGRREWFYTAITRAQERVLIVR